MVQWNPSKTDRAFQNIGHPKNKDILNCKISLAPFSCYFPHDPARGWRGVLNKFYMGRLSRHTNYKSYNTVWALFVSLQENVPFLIDNVRRTQPCAQPPP